MELDPGDRRRRGEQPEQAHAFEAFSPTRGAPMAVEPPGVRTREEDREESDARVIARSRDEPELFAALYDRYADAVHRYAARRLGRFWWISVGEGAAFGACARRAV
jgi:hypothetical protein